METEINLKVTNFNIRVHVIFKKADREKGREINPLSVASFAIIFSQSEGCADRLLTN